MADIKMPSAQELPSGSWRCRVYDKELKKQVSFISKLPDKAGKAEAETMAREYILGKRQKREKGKYCFFHNYFNWLFLCHILVAKIIFVL